MLTTLEPLATEDDSALDRAVLEVLHQRILAESVVDSSTGCRVHPSGSMRYLGGVFQAKRVAFEYANGPLRDDLMLVRRCAEPDCIEATHHVAQTRQEFGAWLGGGSGWRQRASA